MNERNQAIINIREFLKRGKYKFTESIKNDGYSFALKDEFGSSIYVNVWNNDKGYKLLIEEIYPSCRHHILKSIGQTYCSAYGNFTIGKDGVVTEDNIVEEIEKTFKEKERFRKEFIREE